MPGQSPPAGIKSSVLLPSVMPFPRLTVKQYLFIKNVQFSLAAPKGLPVRSAFNIYDQQFLTETKGGSDFCPGGGKLRGAVSALPYRRLWDLILSCLQTKFIRMSWRGIPSQRDDEAISFNLKVLLRRPAIVGAYRNELVW